MSARVAENKEKKAADVLGTLAHEMHGRGLRLPASVAPTAEAAGELFAKMMSLEPITPPMPSVTKFTLSLSAAQEALLSATFKRWSLNSGICLLELLGLEIFTSLKELKEHFKSDTDATRLIDGVIETFCAEFIEGYASMCVEGDIPQGEKDLPKFHFYERNRKNARWAFVITRQEFAFKLKDQAKQLQKLDYSQTLAKTRNKPAETALTDSCARLNLLCNLLKNPQSLVFLTDCSLQRLHEHFPEAANLNGSDPDKTACDLALYARFLAQGFVCAANSRKVVVNCCKNLSVVAGQLEHFAKGKKELESAKAACKMLAVTYLTVDEDSDKIIRLYQDVREGRITHGQWAKGFDIAIEMEKTKEEFSADLYVKTRTYSLFASLLGDLLAILDTRVLSIRHADTFIPVHSCFVRLNVNFGSIFAATRNWLSDTPKKMTVPALPMLISAEQNTKLLDILEAMTTDTHSLFSRLLEQRKFLEGSDSQWRKFNTMSDIFWEQWIPFLSKMKPFITETHGFMPKLQTMLPKHLEQIQAFLNSLDPEQVAENRDAWLEFFQECSLLSCIELCNVTILARDINAVLQLYADPKVYASDEDLLPDALIDFLELEGLEEFLSKFIPKPKVIEPPLVVAPEKPAAPVAPPKAAPAKAVSAAALPAVKPVVHAAPAPAADADEPFRIRRGEKRRKWVARLKDLGFALKRHGKGDHDIWSKQDGKASITIPLHRHLKPGTAASIADLVNKV